MALELPYLEHFGSAFADALPDGWELDAFAKERHGSWEWTASVWPDKRRPHAWVLLAVTPTEASDNRATRAVTEAIAVAEFRNRYTRMPVASLELNLESETAPARTGLVRAQVEMATRQAIGLRAADLTEAYGDLETEEPPPSRKLQAKRIDPLFELPEESMLERAWPELFRARREVSVAEAAMVLGVPEPGVLELALQEVRRGRLRLEQRDREIFLLLGPAELTP
jgi:hypothetical protein